MGLSTKWIYFVLSCVFLGTLISVSARNCKYLHNFVSKTEDYCNRDCNDTSALLTCKNLIINLHQLSQDCHCDSICLHAIHVSKRHLKHCNKQNKKSLQNKNQDQLDQDLNKDEDYTDEDQTDYTYNEDWTDHYTEQYTGDNVEDEKVGRNSEKGHHHGGLTIQEKIKNILNEDIHPDDFGDKFFDMVDEHYGYPKQETYEDDEDLRKSSCKKTVFIHLKAANGENYDIIDDLQDLEGIDEAELKRQDKQLIESNQCYCRRIKHIYVHQNYLKPEQLDRLEDQTQLQADRDLDKQDNEEFQRLNLSPNQKTLLKLDCRRKRLHIHQHYF